MDIATQVTGQVYTIGINTFSGFLHFLMQNNVLQLSLAFIIGNYVDTLSTAFLDDIISPILNKLFPGNDNFENYTLTLFGIPFKIGPFILIILKALLVSFIIFIIVTYTPTLTQQLQNYNPIPVIGNYFIQKK